MSYRGLNARQLRQLKQWWLASGGTIYAHFLLDLHQQAILQNMGNHELLWTAADRYLNDLTVNKGQI